MNTHWPISGPFPGRLMILARPRGGAWLADEIDAWKQLGIHTVVSLIEADEVRELELECEQELSRNAGLEWMSFPIFDRATPSGFQPTTQLIMRLIGKLEQGRAVGVHCRQGIGRSGMLAAAVLIESGSEAQDAIDQVSTDRGVTIPDTEAQRQWIIDYARQHHKLMDLTTVDQ